MEEKARQNFKYLTEKWFWVVGIMLGGSDQVSKLVSRNLGVGQENTGGVLGLLPEFGWAAAAGIILVGILWMIGKEKKWWVKVGWAIVWWAGVSNLVDRVVGGAVWDFIYYPGINVVGNVADVWLGVGLVIVVGAEYWQNRGKRVEG